MLALVCFYGISVEVVDVVKIMVASQRWNDNIERTYGCCIQKLIRSFALVSFNAYCQSSEK